MPNVNWNKNYWDGSYDWSELGEEWSVTWGGSEAQWFGTLYPRLQRLLPARRILEIAPGFGRWTKFLLGQCTEAYAGVDLSDECIQHCRKVFGENGHVSFVNNDGVSLDMLPDGHFDLVYSYDSLVHVEMEVHESYVPQILNKLTPDGVAFIHHSNLKDTSGVDPEQTHARGVSVSAQDYADLVRRSGGVMLLQETHDWGGSVEMIDCISFFARADGAHKGSETVIRNNQNAAFARMIKNYLSPYSDALPHKDVAGEYAAGLSAGLME